MADSKVKTKAYLAAIPMTMGVMAGGVVLYFLGAEILRLLGLSPELAHFAALAFGGFAGGSAVYLAIYNAAAYQAAYKGGVLSALKQYAKALPAEDSLKLLSRLEKADATQLDALMKQAGYKDGYSSLLGATNQMGFPRVPSEMVDIHGNKYNSKTRYGRAASAMMTGAIGAAYAGDDGFSHLNDDAYRQLVNVDGTPMVGDVDVNGNPFGVTNHEF